MKPVGRNKFELDTPCLVLDLDLLDENLQKMQATVAAAGKALRPHAKTHKCSLLAKMQLAAGAVGMGILLIIVGLLVGPGGVSIFN